MSRTPRTEPPWDDCKVAYGVNDGPKVWRKFDMPLWIDRLPKGWTVNGIDGTGARWVVIFRIDGLPTIDAGRAVRRLLRQMDR